MDLDTSAVSSQASPRRGARVALVIGSLAGLGLASVLGLRVSQALHKKEALAAERVQAQASATAVAPRVVTHPVATRWRPHVDVTGSLKPWREADVGFETSGRLAKVLVASGDTVTQGATLALLDGTSAGQLVAMKEASVRASGATLAIAEDSLKRSEALFATKSIPESQLEQAREQVALAKAQMQAAEGDARLARTGQGQHAIFAPFAGVVTRAPTSGGGVVSPGVPLVHVEDLSRFRLSATVSEDDVALVRVGATARVAYRGRSVAGKVIALVPSLDSATRRAPVEIEVPNEPAGEGEQPLLAWAFVRASIGGDRDIDALRIPGTARRPGSQDEVVVVAHGAAHVVRVSASQEADGSWIVRSGLSPSDVVLVAPDGEVHEGDPVGPTTDS